VGGVVEAVLRIRDWIQGGRQRRQANKRARIVCSEAAWQDRLPAGTKTVAHQLEVGRERGRGQHRKPDPPPAPWPVK
jgi:hypothetical protein